MDCNKPIKDLEKLSSTLYEPLINFLKTTDVCDPLYGRSEKGFSYARRISLSFAFSPYHKKDDVYDAARQNANNASVGLMQYIQNLYPDHTCVQSQLATLVPGAELGWHVDYHPPKPFHHYCVRLHVPLITNDKCAQLASYSKQEPFAIDFVKHLEVGRLYELNNMIYHGAYNRGITARTHLILDLSPKDLQ
jgi:hypothetical protein